MSGRVACVVSHLLTFMPARRYAVLNYSQASNSEDDGKLLAFATACTVVVLDIGASMLVYVARCLVATT